MTYQNVAGTLNPGGHPGSHNGQDAYNDMLVTDDVLERRRNQSDFNVKERGGRNGCLTRTIFKL